MDNFNKLSKNLKLQKTSHKKDWKFEHTIKQKIQNQLYGNHPHYNKVIRFKFYGKSEDKLTSTGVSESKTKDPR